MNMSLGIVNRQDAEPTDLTAFGQAQAQFDGIARRLGLNAATIVLLRSPKRELHVLVPVRMDDGSTRIFEGLRVQHNDARGPFKGGIRFHPLTSADDTRALAMLMTWKCALLNLPLGGGKGAIVCDPRRLSLSEQERLCRGWIRQMADNLGPGIDVRGMGGSPGRTKALNSWMTGASREVHERAEHDQVSLRDAACLIAVDRVARACRQRGWVS